MASGRRPSPIYRPDYQYVIKRVREAREGAGMTLKQAADALGRPLSFVSKCELGDRRIDPIDLQDFAELYDRPITYFYPKRQKTGRKTASKRNRAGRE